MSVTNYPLVSGVGAGSSESVLSFTDFSEFPLTGVEGVIYVDELNADLYLWDGAVYELQGGAGGTWGSITGTLGDQTDLQTALDAKLTVPVGELNIFSQKPTFPDILNYDGVEADYFAPNSVLPLDSRALGAGTSFNQAESGQGFAGINSTGKALGVILCSVGTTTTGLAYVGVGRPDLLGTYIIFGHQKQIMGARVSLPLLSTGTETYTQIIGFVDQSTAAPNNGVYFRYNDSVNGGRWEYCKAIGGVITANDTGVTATADNSVSDYHSYEIVVNRAGTEAAFYIDGVLVGTHTGLTITAGLCSGLFMRKSAGTTIRQYCLDKFYFYSETLR